MAQRGVDINGEKLREIFKQRGLLVADVAKESGYLGSSFSRALSNNRLLAQTIAFLKSRYSIDYDEYKPVEEIKEEIKEETEPVVKTLTGKETFEEVKDDLYKLIYAAVYEAVKKAWSE